MIRHLGDFISKTLCRVLSDTCPTYLDGMQRILLFADEVNSHEDMNGFVNMHPHLKSPLDRPKFESFQAMAKASRYR